MSDGELWGAADKGFPYSPHCLPPAVWPGSYQAWTTGPQLRVRDLFLSH